MSIKEGIKITTILPDFLNPKVIVSFELFFHDWCEIEKSVQWIQFQNYLLLKQRLNWLERSENHD